MSTRLERRQCPRAAEARVGNARERAIPGQIEMTSCPVPGTGGRRIRPAQVFGRTSGGENLQPTPRPSARPRNRAPRRRPLPRFAPLSGTSGTAFHLPQLARPAPHTATPASVRTRLGHRKDTTRCASSSFRQRDTEFHIEWSERARSGGRPRALCNRITEKALNLFYLFCAIIDCINFFFSADQRFDPAPGSSINIIALWHRDQAIIVPWRSK